MKSSKTKQKPVHAQPNMQTMAPTLCFLPPASSYPPQYPSSANPNSNSNNNNTNPYSHSYSNHSNNPYSHSHPNNVHNTNIAHNIVHNNFSIKNTSIIQSIYLCMNPHCTTPYTRVFGHGHSHHSMEVCKGRWVVSLAQLGSIVKGEIIGNCNNNNSGSKSKGNNGDGDDEGQGVKLIQFGFGSKNVKDGLKAWVTVDKIDWNQYFTNLKKVFMDKIQLQITKTLLQVKQKITLLKSSQAKSLISSIYSNLTTQKPSTSTPSSTQTLASINNPQSQLNQLIKSHISPLTHTSILIKCPQSTDLTEPLINITNILKQKLYTGKQQQNNNKLVQVSVVGQKQHQQLRKFMLQDMPNFNKMQQIASFCGKKLDNFQIKAKSIAFKCPFCKYIQKQKLSVTDKYQQQLKIVKKQLAIKLLQHAFNCHYSAIYQKYAIKFHKKTAASLMNYQPMLNNRGGKGVRSMQLSYCGLINMIKQRKPTNLIIFDRQSGIPPLNAQSLHQALSSLTPSLPSSLSPSPSSPSSLPLSLPSSLPSPSSPIIPKSTLYIDILSRPNRSMSKILHLLTPDRKCTQFIINYFIVQISMVQKLVPLSNISILSNVRDINRVKGIMEVLMGQNVRGEYCNYGVKKQQGGMGVGVGRDNKGVKREGQEGKGNVKKQGRIVRDMLLVNGKHIKKQQSGIQHQQNYDDKSIIQQQQNNQQEQNQQQNQQLEQQQQKSHEQLLPQQNQNLNYNYMTFNNNDNDDEDINEDINENNENNENNSSNNINQNEQQQQQHYQSWPQSQLQQQQQQQQKQDYQVQQQQQCCKQQYQQGQQYLIHHQNNNNNIDNNTYQYNNYYNQQQQQYDNQYQQNNKNQNIKTNNNIKQKQQANNNKQQLKLNVKNVTNAINTTNQLVKLQHIQHNFK